MAETYYEVLGVSPDASSDEIEAAYRERLKETHPDVSDDEDASDRTKQLIDAKEVLTDADERARYDRLGHQAYVEADESDTPSTPAGTPSSNATASGGRTEPADSWTRATADTTGEESSETATDQTSQERRRRYNQQTPRDSWNTTRDTAAGANSRRAWDTSGGYTVHGDEATGYGGLIPSGQELILLAATLVCYPILLWGALFPSFPLTVNVAIGGCLLVLVAYLQSIPEVGILVYGSWTLLLPAGLYGIGVSLTRPLVLVAVVVTALSFGLTLLTRAVVGP